MSGLDGLANTIASSLLAGGAVLATLIIAFALAIRAGRGKRLRNDTKDQL